MDILRRCALSRVNLKVRAGVHIIMLPRVVILQGAFTEACYLHIDARASQVRPAQYRRYCVSMLHATVRYDTYAPTRHLLVSAARGDKTTVPCYLRVILTLRLARILPTLACEHQ